MLANDTPRPSVDTLGLVVVKHTVRIRPEYAQADGIAGPEHFEAVEETHEPIEGETVGELLARLGLDEGDRIEIRFPTVDEDRAKLAKLIAEAR
jgi:hypothetical protein